MGFSDQSHEQRQQLKSTYPELYPEVFAILSRHDPMKLISLGASADEYEPEVDAILVRLPDVTSERELRFAIYEVFVSMFDSPSLAGSESDYAAIARDIWQAWQEYES